MNIKDAAKILNLTGEITPKDTKAAFRKAAMQYHPDRNPAGAEMMEIINAAYDALREYTGETPTNDNQNTEGETAENYSNAVNEAFNKIINLDGLDIEICGSWVWVSGETRIHKEILTATAHSIVTMSIVVKMAFLTMGNYLLVLISGLHCDLKLSGLSVDTAIKIMALLQNN